VLEIVGADEDTAAALASLAARLRSLPWRTPGPLSVLQRLRLQPLPEQAETALLCAAQLGTGSTARADALLFVDVAACLSGVTPAWTGGPLTWLWAEREKMAPRFTGATRVTWEGMEPVLRETYS
jgi:3-hydroxyacyl-CoA dehydrogenase / enoyl-CoA hydratase / 3-hydroxybutyryl-CoA epimerase